MSVARLHAAGRRGPAPARMALLGTGTVGAAVAARYSRLRERGIALPQLAWISNSRTQLAVDASPEDTVQLARRAPPRQTRVPPWAEAESPGAGDIVVDATASEQVADWHREWLLRGVHVVTANKLGAGGELARAQAIAAALAGGARYGDSATVGAGLPLLRSIRALVAGGDRIQAVEGVLSGSLAWLCWRHDGARAFSELVREAREAGYTEPDPRQDLSGDDVRRKLLILARAAGLPLEATQVQAESLLPDGLKQAEGDEIDARLALLDEPLRTRLIEANAHGEVLRFVGRFDARGEASLGLRSLPAAHPLAGGEGTDNQVAIWSDRYRERPLVIRGPGAGADVTAAALLDDVLTIAG